VEFTTGRRGRVVSVVPDGNGNGAAASASE